VYFPFQSGRLSVGLQAWQDDSSGRGSAANSDSSTNSHYQKSDINAFLTWEVRW